MLRKKARRATTPPLLSLCMIVKNEAATLEQCLRLARPHVDEIAVVDTGSTDGTQYIARRYADVFDEIEWPDSFSIARNHSLDLAGGRFLLILDGDEYIEEEQSWREIDQGLRQQNVAAMQVRVRNVLPDTQILAAGCIWQERIVRNHPSLRYEGAVHNQIQPAILRHVQATRQRVLRVPAEVVHVGYALPQEQKNRKYEPRLRLLQREIDEASDPQVRAFYQYQLGDAFSMMARFAEAAAVLNEIDYGSLVPENAYYTHLMAAYANLMQKNPALTMLHANAMLEIDREEPVGFYITALGLLALGHAGDALHMFIGAYEKNYEGTGQVRFPLHDAQLYRLIGTLCASKGLVERARFFLGEYLKHHPGDEQIQRLMWRLEHTLKTRQKGAPNALKSRQASAPEPRQARQAGTQASSPR